MKLCHSFASLAGLTLQVLLFSGTSTFVNGHPTNLYGDSLYNETSVWGQDAELTLNKRQTRGTPLRIMALGASIVYGVGSSHNNG